MADETKTGTSLAELLAALSLGIDLAFDQPLEHVLRQCLIALRLCELAGVDADSHAAAYYSALLVNVGCHTDAHEQVHWFGDDMELKRHKYDDAPGRLAELTTLVSMLGAGSAPLHRLRVGFAFLFGGHKQVEAMITEHARLARSLGEELNLPSDALAALGCSYERWDGKGFPGERSGTDIPIASRIIQLAEFAEVAQRERGADAAIQMAEHGSATQFDPSLVAILRHDAEKIFQDLDEMSSWDSVLGADPGLLMLDEDELDEALAAIARFVDLKSPYTLGHSEAVAELACRATSDFELPREEHVHLRRAGLTAGFGRLGVSNAIWEKPGPLTSAEWERVRQVPMLGSQVLRQSTALTPAARTVLQHRERLDGSGYPAALTGDAISRPARILAAADSYQAMLEPRPHRPPLTPPEAAAELRSDAKAGRLDHEAVSAVLIAAGHRVRRRREGTAGLTNREVEVLRLAAQGLSNKDIAARLTVTTKTVGNHIEHIYTKIGVSNRAGAALFAMRNGLVPDETWA